MYINLRIYVSNTSFNRFALMISISEHVDSRRIPIYWSDERMLLCGTKSLRFLEETTKKRRKNLIARTLHQPLGARSFQEEF